MIYHSWFCQQTIFLWVQERYGLSHSLYVFPFPHLLSIASISWLVYLIEIGSDNSSGLWVTDWVGLEGCSSTYLITIFKIVLSRLFTACIYMFSWSSHCWQRWYHWVLLLFLQQVFLAAFLTLLIQSFWVQLSSMILISQSPHIQRNWKLKNWCWHWRNCNFNINNFEIIHFLFII